MSKRFLFPSFGLPLIHAYNPLWKFHSNVYTTIEFGIEWRFLFIMLYHFEFSIIQATVSRKRSNRCEKSNCILNLVIVFCILLSHTFRYWESFSAIIQFTNAHGMYQIWNSCNGLNLQTIVILLYYVIRMSNIFVPSNENVNIVMPYLPNIHNTRTFKQKSEFLLFHIYTTVSNRLNCISSIE